MNVLVFNCGSSSLKYKLVDVDAGKIICGGEAERVGVRSEEPSQIVHRDANGESRHPVPMENHSDAYVAITELLAGKHLPDPDAYGHRVVHGGPDFQQSVVITPEVLSRLDECSILAPIHNPPALALIRFCAKAHPLTPQIAVFDTAFHATIPPRASTYALPRDLRRLYNIKKYGFHGTSHRYVAQQAAKLLDRPLHDLNLVTCHLGSGGASLCAIEKGKSVDNTMGFSPLAGLVMSTRPGDLDPALPLYLTSLAGGDTGEVESLFNKRSGVSGLSGFSSDIRDVWAMRRGNPQAELATRLYTERIRKYLAAYLTVLGRTDAVVFTDTIGERCPEIREAVCQNLEFFGLVIDPQANRSHALPLRFEAASSTVAAFAIRTDEEMAIAIETAQTLAA